MRHRRHRHRAAASCSCTSFSLFPPFVSLPADRCAALVAIRPRAARAARGGGGVRSEPRDLQRPSVHGGRPSRLN